MRKKAKTKHSNSNKSNNNIDNNNGTCDIFTTASNWTLTRLGLNVMNISASVQQEPSGNLLLYYKGILPD